MEQKVFISYQLWKQNDEDEDAQYAAEISAIRIQKRAKGASQDSNDEDAENSSEISPIRIQKRAKGGSQDSTDEDAQNASTTSPAIPISKKAEGALQVSNDEEAQNASEISPIRIPKKAEGALQVSTDASELLIKQGYSNAERFTASARPEPYNAMKLLIDTPFKEIQNNDVEEYANDVRLTPSAPPEDDERKVEHRLRSEGALRLTPSTPPEDDESKIEHGLRPEGALRLTYSAPPEDDKSKIEHGLRPEGALRLNPYAPPEDYERKIEHGLSVDDDVRLTPTAPPYDDEEWRPKHGLRVDNDARLTPTAPPCGDEERRIGHDGLPESVQAICRRLISMTQDENGIRDLMLKGLTEPELDVIRWQNPQLRRHYKDWVYKVNISRDLENYQPGFYFVSDKNQKGSHETLHCTAIIVVPCEGKPRYFDSHGNVPDELRDRVEWSRSKPQKNVNTCAFHCLYVFDMWTKHSTAVSHLPAYSGLTVNDFIDGLYSPIENQDWTTNDVACADNVSIKRSCSEEGEGTSEHRRCSFEQGDSNPNFDPDIKVMLYFKNNLLPALRKFISDADVEVNPHPYS